jgi:hypothetical protein
VSPNRPAPRYVVMKTFQYVSTSAALNRLFAISVLTALVVPACAADAVVSADTFISQGSAGIQTATTNYGAAASLSVGPGDSALIQFDLSALQSLNLTSANIQKATLTLFVNLVIEEGGWMSASPDRRGRRPARRLTTSI